MSDLNLAVSTVNFDDDENRKININLSFSADEIISNMPIHDVIGVYGRDTFLRVIGVDAAKSFFNLVDAD